MEAKVTAQQAEIQKLWQQTMATIDKLHDYYAHKTVADDTKPSSQNTSMPDKSGAKLNIKPSGPRGAKSVFTHPTKLSRAMKALLEKLQKDIQQTNQNTKELRKLLEGRITALEEKMEMMEHTDKHVHEQLSSLYLMKAVLDGFKRNAKKIRYSCKLPGAQKFEMYRQIGKDSKLKQTIAEYGVNDLQENKPLTLQLFDIDSKTGNAQLIQAATPPLAIFFTVKYADLKQTDKIYAILAAQSLQFFLVYLLSIKNQRAYEIMQQILNPNAHLNMVTDFIKPLAQAAHSINNTFDEDNQQMIATIKKYLHKHAADRLEFSSFLRSEIAKQSQTLDYKICMVIILLLMGASQDCEFGKATLSKMIMLVYSDYAIKVLSKVLESDPENSDGTLDSLASVVQETGLIKMNENNKAHTTAIEDLLCMSIRHCLHPYNPENGVYNLITFFTAEDEADEANYAKPFFEDMAKELCDLAKSLSSKSQIQEFFDQQIVKLQEESNKTKTIQQIATKIKGVLMQLPQHVKQKAKNSLFKLYHVHDKDKEGNFVLGNHRNTTMKKIQDGIDKFEIETMQQWFDVLTTPPDAPRAKFEPYTKLEEIISDYLQQIGTKKTKSNEGVNNIQTLLLLCAKLPNMLDTLEEASPDYLAINGPFEGNTANASQQPDMNVKAQQAELEANQLELEAQQAELEAQQTKLEADKLEFEAQKAKINQEQANAGAY
jgi:hypothetical protein